MNICSSVLKEMGGHIRQLNRGSVQDKVFFLHIPKCGGTSVNQALEWSFGWKAALGGQLAAPDILASRRAAELAGKELMDFRECLLLYFMAQPRLRYIGGHFSYSEAAYRQYGNEWQFVTILRDPVDKWFSFYFYKYFNSTSIVRSKSGINEYLETEEAKLFGCDYVRKLTQGIPAGDLHRQYAIDQAIENLKKFELVGLLEHLDVFSARFAERFGARLNIKTLNTSPYKAQKQKAESTPELRQQVEALCGPDIKIYQYLVEQLGKI